MSLPILAKKMKKLASLQFHNIKLFLNGKNFNNIYKMYKNSFKLIIILLSSINFFKKLF